MARIIGDQSVVPAAVPRLVPTGEVAPEPGVVRIRLPATPRHVSWSPDGQHLALVLHWSGVWTLDWKKMTLAPVLTGWSSWRRSVWAGEGAVLYLSGPSELIRAEYSTEGWRISCRTPAPALTHWVPWDSRGTLAGLAPSHSGGVDVVSFDVRKEALKVSETVDALHQTAALDWREGPVWWDDGSSILALGGPSTGLAPYQVDIDTGLCEGVSLGPAGAPGKLHCLGRAQKADVLAGCVIETVGPQHEGQSEEIVAIRNRGTQIATIGHFRLLAIPSPLAVSPSGERVALTDADGLLCIADVPAWPAGQTDH